MIDWNVKNLVNFFHERNFVWICDALIWRILFDVMNIPLAELVLSLAVLPVVVNIFGQRCKRREMTKWWYSEKCVWRFEFYIRLCFKSKLCLSSSPNLGSEYIFITLIFLLSKISLSRRHAFSSGQLVLPWHAIESSFILGVLLRFLFYC